MFDHFSNPHTLNLIETQRRHVEALAHTALSLDTPMLDHLRDLLDVVPKRHDVESLTAQLRNRLNAER